MDDVVDDVVSLVEPLPEPNPLRRVLMSNAEELNEQAKIVAAERNIFSFIMRIMMIFEMYGQN